MPSTLIPNNPTIIVSTRPHPPKTAKLWLTLRLLSWDLQIRVGSAKADEMVKFYFVKEGQTCNQARTLLCMTSWIVNKRPRTASCSSSISLVFFLKPSSNWRAMFPLRCWTSSKIISSLACSDHFTLMTCHEKTKTFTFETTVRFGFTTERPFKHKIGRLPFNWNWGLPVLIIFLSLDWEWYWRDLHPHGFS